MTYPLMPKATAVWLIDNTALTFDQIADFCGLHALEIKGIADGDVAQGIKGLDPVSNSQLTRDELERCQADSETRLQISTSDRNLPEPKKQKGTKYTPLSKRQERPDAIYWLVRNHPELNDAQISRLIGTTKPTIQAIRDRSHWNISNLKPVDPVTLGLCKQMDLDYEVTRAANRAERAQKKLNKEQGIKTEETLLPAEESVLPEPVIEQEPAFKAPKNSSVKSVFGEPTPVAAEEEEAAPDADSVFGSFKKSDNKKR